MTALAPLDAPEPGANGTPPPEPAMADPEASAAAKTRARDAVAAALLAGTIHLGSTFDAVRFALEVDVPAWMLRAAWEQARENAPSAGPAPTWDDGAPDDDARPIIRIAAGPGEIGRMIQEAIKALGEGDPNLFQRSGALVRIVREPERREPYEMDQRVGNSILTRPGTPKVEEIGPTLLERIDAVSAWERWDARKGEAAEQGKKGGKRAGAWIACNPDTTIVRQLERRKLWPGIKPIHGIAETPFLAPSHRIVQVPGYDEETRTVLLPTVDIGRDIEQPTQEHARAALQYLWIETSCDFPFRGVGEPSDADPDRLLQYARALESPDAFVGVGMQLTAFARLAILGAVPGGMFEAAARGSGKSLQMHVCSTVYTGRPAGVATFPMRDGRPDEPELEKILAGYALAAARLVAFDNIKGVLGGQSIEKALTAERNIDLRVLGSNNQVSLPWSAILLLTGNNIVTSDDIADRLLVSRLESPREEPRRRPISTFRHGDLLTAMFAQRAKLVRACLVILRAYLWAKERGETVEEPIRGSYVAWSRIVPGALLYAGGPDILRAFPEGGTGGDEEGEAHGALLRYWRDDWNGQKASYILGRVFDGERDRDSAEKDPQMEEMRAAVRSLTRTREGGTPGAVAFGMRMRGLRGRIRDGRKLDAVRDPTSKQWVYTMVQVSR